MPYLNLFNSLTKLKKHPLKEHIVILKQVKQPTQGRSL